MSPATPPVSYPEQSYLSFMHDDNLYPSSFQPSTPLYPPAANYESYHHQTTQAQPSASQPVNYHNQTTQAQPVVRQSVIQGD